MDHLATTSLCYPIICLCIYPHAQTSSDSRIMLRSSFEYGIEGKLANGVEIVFGV